MLLKSYLWETIEEVIMAMHQTRKESKADKQEECETEIIRKGRELPQAVRKGVGNEKPLLESYFSKKSFRVFF